MFREVTIDSYLDGGAVTTVTVLPQHAHLSRKEFAAQYPKNLLAMKARMFDLVYEQVIRGGCFEDICSDVLMDGDEAWKYTNVSDQEKVVEEDKPVFLRSDQMTPEQKSQFEAQLMFQIKILSNLSASLRGSMNPEARAISDKLALERLEIEKERWGNNAPKQTHEACGECQQPMAEDDVAVVDCPRCDSHIANMCLDCSTESMADDCRDECEAGRCRASTNDDSDLPADIIERLEREMQKHEQEQTVLKETSSEAHKTPPRRTLEQTQ
jgi:hypothetical protein